MGSGKLKNLWFIGLMITFSFTTIQTEESWIRINLLGYKPGSVKVAVWVGKSKTAITSFVIVDAASNKMVFESAQFELNIPLPNQTLNFEDIKKRHNSEDVLLFKGQSAISSSFDLHYFKYGIEKSEQIIAHSILNSINRVNDSKIPNQREDLIESLKNATQQKNPESSLTTKKALK